MPHKLNSFCSNEQMKNDKNAQKNTRFVWSWQEPVPIYLSNTSCLSLPAFFSVGRPVISKTSRCHEWWRMIDWGEDGGPAASFKQKPTRVTDDLRIQCQWKNLKRALFKLFSPWFQLEWERQTYESRVLYIEREWHIAGESKQMCERSWGILEEMWMEQRGWEWMRITWGQWDFMRRDGEK